MLEEVQVRQYFCKLDIHKSMGPDGMHPQVLMELAYVIVRPLSIIFDQSCHLGDVPEDQRKANLLLFSRKTRRGQPQLVNYNSIAGSVMEQLILETISRHTKDSKVIGSSQHSFKKGKQCLTSLVTFYDEMTCLVVEG